MESKYAGISAYNYSFNNPVMLNDPSGADPQQQTANPPIAYTHDDNGDIQGYIGEVTITSGKKSTGSAADNTAYSPSAGYGLQAQAMKEGFFLGQFRTSDRLTNNDLYYPTPFGWAAAGIGGIPYSNEVRAASGLFTVNEARQADSDGQSDYQWALNNQLRQAAAEGYNEVQRLNNPIYLGFKAGKAVYDFSPIHAGISAYKDYQAGNNTGAV